MGSASTAVWTSSSTGNPSDTWQPAARAAAAKPWVAPAASVRTSTRGEPGWPGRAAAGRQRHLQDLHVIDGGVGPGVARTEQTGQRLPTGHVRAVQVGQQRMEPKRLLPGLGRILLLR